MEAKDRSEQGELKEKKKGLKMPLKLQIDFHFPANVLIR
jgi:hypothetical protein